MTNELTPDKLAALRALAMGATPGKRWIGDADFDTALMCKRDGRNCVLANHNSNFPEYQRDIELFAALDPATVLGLIDRHESPIEIRNNEDGILDEIVATGADVHLEEMDEGCWCLIVSKGEQRFQVMLESDADIIATVETEGMEL